MKKKYNLEERKINITKLWFNNYVSTLNTVIDRKDNIHLLHDVESYSSLIYEPEFNLCIIEFDLWTFMLNELPANEYQIIYVITKWFETNYNLEDVDFGIRKQIDMYLKDY